MPSDKINKIDKIEGDKKAQAVIKKASNANSKGAKSASKPAPKVTNKSAVKATKTKAQKPKAAKKPSSKEAAKNFAKKAHKKTTTFALGVVSASEKKIAKIEAFFAKFIKNAKDKNDFIEAAILHHIKKCKKKFKKS